MSFRDQTTKQLYHIQTLHDLEAKCSSFHLEYSLSGLVYLSFFCWLVVLDKDNVVQDHLELCYQKDKYVCMIGD